MQPWYGLRNMNFKSVHSWPANVLDCNTGLCEREKTPLPELTVTLCKVPRGLGDVTSPWLGGAHTAKCWRMGMFCFVAVLALACAP